MQDEGGYYMTLTSFLQSGSKSVFREPSSNVPEKNNTVREVRGRVPVAQSCSRGHGYPVRCSVGLEELR